MTVFFMPLEQIKESNLYGYKAYNLSRCLAIKEKPFFVPQGVGINRMLYQKVIKLYQKDIVKILSDCDYSKHQRIYETSLIIINVINNINVNEILMHLEQPAIPFKTDRNILRSSAVDEDSARSAFAGIYGSYDVEGYPDIIPAIKKVYGSLFSVRALYHRHRLGFTGLPEMALVLQEKITPSISGVMFTQHPDTGENLMHTTMGYGSCDAIVNGNTLVSEYLLRRGRVYQENVEGETPPHTLLSKHEIRKLFHTGKVIDTRFKCPMDIEWSYDKGKIFVLQARPITRIRIWQEKEAIIEKRKESTITEGILVRAKTDSFITGKVLKLSSPKDFINFKPGHILVVEDTDPDWEPFMAVSLALITNHGTRTSHAALTARELNIPAIVGTGDATEVLQEGQEIILDFTDKYIGRVLNGSSY